MSEKILSEYDERVAERQIVAILQSPQGRDFGRWFLTEKGKGPEGNMAQIKRELFDIFSRKISDLYSAEAPAISGAISGR